MYKSTSLSMKNHSIKSTLTYTLTKTITVIQCILHLTHHFGGPTGDDKVKNASQEGVKLKQAEFQTPVTDARLNY